MTDPVPFGNATNTRPGGSSNTAPAPPLRSPEAPKPKVADLPDVDEPPLFQAEPQWDDSMLVDGPEELGPAGLFDGVQTFPGDGLPVEDRPLISQLVPMTNLREEYENGSQTFVMQIDWLMKQGWVGIRRTRGDGDCFYRSLAFAYIERILHATEPTMAVISAISVLETTESLLERVGFQKLVFEDFYDDFLGLINAVIQPRQDGQLLTINSLLEAFNVPEVSNSVVMYLRMLTSAEIKSEAMEYSPFLFNPETTEPMDPESFCNNFVEAIGKEADHVQMSALSKVMKVNINVAYLDGHDAQGTVSFVSFQNAPDPDTEPVHLLYRPGHYDILDRRSEDPLPPLIM
ncbi:Ubiquitin thioesterase otubain-like [Trametes pubescens]|uniref:ubiquitinyl hydrolase 1 n=1 Tax=Trametes pubescens TaxID=154538 RepID=A0A1M2W323_TRAPU|nr:Ubiquitin thioesterase otubain-like [Trametes pubescens]